MAVTSIWAVKVHVDQTIEYIVNPEKTTQRPELVPEAVAARRAVGDVINYAGNADKTEQMMYVTGINCDPEYAVEEFMKTKEYWRKTGGRLAYHGYQSFLEGDGKITAEKAHEIGVKLAKELWGDRFEVVVATHLNTGHYHNHFVVNSVSFSDGYKYVRFDSDYKRMREVSDRLCKEARLNIVEDPAYRKSKSYDEWKADKEGKVTVRGTIRKDIDYAIAVSHSERDFAEQMRELGYEFKFFRKDGSYLEHPGLKPPGAKGYFRFRGLGPGYDYESIRRRIIEHSLVPCTPSSVDTQVPDVPYEPARAIGLANKYIRYCLRIRAYLIKPAGAKPEYIPMALREDIIKLDRYIKQMDFLIEHNISNKNSLQEKKTALLFELDPMIAERKKLYSARKRAWRHNDSDELAEVNDKIHGLNDKIRDIKQQLRLCDAVSASADRVSEGADLPTEPEVRTLLSSKKDDRFRKTGDPIK